MNTLVEKSFNLIEVLKKKTEKSIKKTFQYHRKNKKNQYIDDKLY